MSKMKTRFLSDINEDFDARSETDKRVRKYITPKSVVWKSVTNGAKVENEEVLLRKREGQITLHANEPCILRNKGAKASILLDFGFEIQGGIQILAWSTGRNKSARLRVRFGESAMEAMSELFGEKNSTNDHAVRDLETEVSFMGNTEIGNTGFRFVRIDLLDEHSFVELKSVRAIFLYKDIEYKGSFRCNDELINKIWDTGAYTVHLCMQDYLWDGIKRDRLVWIGDSHPETLTIQAVFGYDEAIPKSLDLVRDETKLPGWMNDIPSYSMWWILVHEAFYNQNGNKEYLKEQRSYLLRLLEQLQKYISEDGRDLMPNRFFDWPSSDNKKAVEAGVHALFILTMEAGNKLCNVLGEKEAGLKCSKSAETLRKYCPHHGGSKQAAAFLALSGLEDSKSINESILSVGGSRGMSTFLGYYVLKAKALAGDIKGAIDCIREYWGGMLKMGATTFWEDFNIDWMKGAAAIDEIITDDRIDIHGCYGDYCYKGYRHSLCHGWASGPTAWISEYVLGVKILEPGCKVIKIEPQLGDLQWAEGTYPTPEGVIYIRHEKQENGSILTKIEAPENITIIREA